MTHRARSYGVPPLTIKLGTVLEAAIRMDGKVIVVHEWRGMQLLTDYDAFERAQPKLYLVRSKASKVSAVEYVSQTAIDRGVRDYYRWTKQQADKLLEVFSAANVNHRHGRMVRLDYRSDKWHKGRFVEYTHDFTEAGGKPPVVYTNSKTLAAAKTVVAFGGTMTIAKAGIA